MECARVAASGDALKLGEDEVKRLRKIM